MQRPEPNEFDPYYSLYIDRVPDGDVVEILSRQGAETVGLLEGVDEERALHRYAPDKWSLKEVVGHVVDAERIFGFRAMAFARGDGQPYPGMDQDDYARNAAFDGRSLASLVEEFRGLRASHVALFGSFGEEVSLRKGVASGCPFSVRSLVYVIGGHEAHHVGVLRERYL
ncbi:MAG: DinB family protein [bacterium]|nr:DinB family protein [bacterium]